MSINSCGGITTRNVREKHKQGVGGDARIDKRRTRREAEKGEERPPMVAGSAQAGKRRVDSASISSGARACGAKLSTSQVSRVTCGGHTAVV